MSRRKKFDSVIEPEVTTEEELQEKWSRHPSPTVDSVLSARRERQRENQPFFSVDEINEMLGRGGDDD